MTDQKKGSLLPSGTPIQSADTFFGIQNGVTVQQSGTRLKNFLNANLPAPVAALGSLTPQVNYSFYFTDTSGNMAQYVTSSLGRTLAGIANAAAGRAALSAAESGVNTDITSIAGSAASLTTARSIAATGDATWSVIFDGSAAVTAALTLAATGVAAGTYGSVTVDAKGRVTAASTLTPVANGGTGRNTTAAYLADLVTAGAYSKTSILGTVSQSAGVPTGAVIERGSNANGEYVKFADGTMICQQYIASQNVTIAAFGALFAGAAPAWTFPVAFVGVVPSVTVDAFTSGRLTLLAHGAAHSLTAASMSIIDPSGAGTFTYALKYTAIGRWF